ncbi:hypothetical protein J6590_019799 [Homalodisca vitripennis]|nr:hypothetical protein J6590_019799 [Homalodisca vitripennis]
MKRKPSTLKPDLAMTSSLYFAVAASHKSWGEDRRTRPSVCDVIAINYNGLRPHSGRVELVGSPKHCYNNLTLAHGLCQIRWFSLNQDMIYEATGLQSANSFHRQQSCCIPILQHTILPRTL